MVILREMTLKNFKTFNGEHNIIFYGKFVAIVGPNGAGKSNFVDAISFVMGSKVNELRVSKVEQLVSFGRNKMGMEVSATLQIPDGIEIRFKRSVMNSNCFYFINDNQVDSKVYVDKLKGLNINATAKNFLVFQASVESIIMKKPNERTAIFEDISGSNKFKAEYDRLNSLMVTLEQDCQHLQKTSRSIAKDIKNMEHCRERAREFEKLSKDKDKALINRMLFDLYHGKRKIDDLRIEEGNLKKTLNELTGGKFSKEKKLRHLINKCESMELDIAHKEAALRSKELEINDAEADLVKIRAKKQYTEKQIDSFSKSLESAKNADSAHKSIISELEVALEKQQKNKNEYAQEYSATLGRDVILSESQSQQYENLRISVCSTCANDNQTLLILEREYKALQDIYEMENTRKCETENAIAQKRGLLNATEKRIEKLIDSVRTLENKLDVERASYTKLTSTFEGYKQEELYLKHEIDNINDQLGNSKDDAAELVEMREKKETANTLRRHFIGVHDRLGNLCRPIHDRYNVAVTKVLGKNVNAIVVDTSKIALQCIDYLKCNRIAAETFLPLDDIRTYKLMVHLRDIRDPPNVKLVFDILDFPPEFENAVLYATRNTLVCETPDDATKVIFEKKYGHDCISLDGCYYSKTGIISGGNLDLSRKAKRWDAQKKESLKLEKENLTKRLREILKLMPQESDLSVLAVTIKSFESRLKFMKSDEISGHKDMEKIETELKALENELENRQAMWTKAKSDMDNSSKAINNLKSFIEAKENEIFADLCKTIGVENIRDYENGKKSFDKKITEFDNQIGRIQDQLTFEYGRDTKNLVERWEKNLRKANTELSSIIEQEHIQQSSLSETSKNVDSMKARCIQVRSFIQGLKGEISSLREEIADLSRKHKSLVNKVYQIQHSVEKQKSQIQAILTEAKVKSFHIVATNHRESNPSQTSEMSSDSPTVTSASETNELEAIMEIDFSKLPKELRELADTEIDNERARLNEIVTNVTSEIDMITGPTMRTSQHLTLEREKLKETNRNLKDKRDLLKKTSASFDIAKDQRYREFMLFFENVGEQVDAIYKKLMGNQAAQAYILPENPEEPYLGGIRYDCVVPGKPYQIAGTLSGGEKSLAALALLFAIQRVQETPPPFQVLDEIDAALDHKNTLRVINYIKESRESQQSIVITHKIQFSAGADVLIGIYRQVCDSVVESKILTFDIRGYRD